MCPPTHCRLLITGARWKPQNASSLTARNFRLDESLERMERSYVEAALALTSGNLSQAAKLLGIHRTTLYSRMQSYGAVADRNAPDQ